MKVDSSTASLVAAGTPGGSRRASSPDEAAKQFEEVLVRELVKSMTKDLFKSGLQGEDGPGWVESNSDTQRDMLTDALTTQLVERNTLGLADMLTRRWSLKTETPPTE